MSISKNTAYNLMGTVAPVIVALISIPVYINLIGEQRYGMLSIAWVLLGYFGIFDLGIGRAATQRIAALDLDHVAKSQCFWTALSLNSIFGILGGLLIWPAANYYFKYLFDIDPSIKPEISQAILWLVIAMPIATVGSVLSGSLQGVEKFLHLNFINATGSILFLVFPLFAAWIWTPSLSVLMPIAISARLLTVAALFYTCKKYVATVSGPKFCFNESRALMKFGGWVTVSSLISPIMVIADRFIIGAVLGAKSVTEYAVPYQLAERTTIIPAALSSSLFPKFAKNSMHNNDQIAIISVRLLIVVMTPIMLVTILLAQPILSLWISSEFAGRTYLVMQLMLAGFWINGLARIPHSQLQATGRPKIVAICHLIEIIPYLAVLHVCLAEWGIAGAAAAFTLRVLFDYFLLSAQTAILRQTVFITVGGLLFIVSAIVLAQQELTGINAAVLGCSLIALSILWSAMLAPDILKQQFRKLRNRA